MYIKKLILEYHLVDSCNLKCAGCSHYSSLLDELTYIKVEDIISDLSLLKSKVGDNLTVLKLMGGEPLLHPQICECLNEIRKIFSKTKIVIVTNGILLKSKKMPDEFYNICSKLNIQIHITDYGLFNVEEILDELKDLGIKTRLYRNSTKDFIWHYKHIRLTKGIINCLSKCIFKKLTCNYRNGKIYLCPHIAYIDFFNKYFGQNIMLDDTDYISLDKIDSFGELMIKINLARPNFCYRYCNYYDETHPEIGKWHTTEKKIDEFCLIQE